MIAHRCEVRHQTAVASQGHLTYQSGHKEVAGRLIRSYPQDNMVVACNLRAVDETLWKP